MKNYKECYNNLIKDLENLIDKYNGKLYNFIKGDW